MHQTVHIYRYIINGWLPLQIVRIIATYFQYFFGFYFAARFNQHIVGIWSGSPTRIQIGHTQMYPNPMYKVEQNCALLCVYGRWPLAMYVGRMVPASDGA